MRFRPLKPVLAPCLALAMTFWAGVAAAQNTPATSDELGSWLADKGLFSQMAQVGQSVTNKASELNDMSCQNNLFQYRLCQRSTLRE